MAIGRGTATGRKRQFDPAPPVAANVWSGQPVGSRQRRL